MGAVGVEILAFPLTWHIAYTTAVAIAQAVTCRHAVGRPWQSTLYTLPASVFLTAAQADGPA